MSNSDADGIPVAAALRLKHEINKSITDAGLNALELRKLVRLDDTQHVNLADELANIRKNWWTLPDWFLVAAFLGAAGALFYVDSTAWRAVAFAFAIVFAAQIGYRTGFLLGFRDGYHAGHEQGVLRALNISAEDYQESGERALEMEMDGGVIDLMNQRADKSA
jgi:hypothetical protein